MVYKKENQTSSLLSGLINFHPGINIQEVLWFFFSLFFFSFWSCSPKKSSSLAPFQVTTSSLSQLQHASGVDACSRWVGWSWLLLSSLLTPLLLGQAQGTVVILYHCPLVSKADSFLKGFWGRPSETLSSGSISCLSSSRLLTILPSSAPGLLTAHSSPHASLHHSQRYSSLGCRML